MITFVKMYARLTKIYHCVPWKVKKNYAAGKDVLSRTGFLSLTMFFMPS